MDAGIRVRRPSRSSLRVGELVLLAAFPAALRDASTDVPGNTARLASATPGAAKSGKTSQRQHQPHQVCLPRNALLAEDLLQVPANGTLRAPCDGCNVTHGSAGSYHGCHPALGRSQVQGLRHEPGIDPGPAHRIDDQHERGDPLRAQILFALGHGHDVNDQPGPGVRRPTVIEPADAGPPRGGSARASSRCRVSSSPGNRSIEETTKVGQPSVLRRRSRARSLAATMRARGSSWMTLERPLSSNPRASCPARRHRPARHTQHAN